MTDWLNTSTYSGVGGYATSEYYGQASVDVTETASSVTISGGTGIWYRNWSYRGIGHQFSINGEVLTSYEGYPTSATNSFQLLSASEKFYSKTFQKTGSDQTVTLNMQAFGKYVSGVATSAGGDVSGSMTITIPALALPNAPTSPTATRNSDTSAAFSWTAGSGVVTRYYVERSTDGGDYASLGYVSGSTTSYTDSSVSANHSYTYRVRAWNARGYSSYATASTIYMTPAAPASVSGASSGGTTVILTISNPALTATGFDVQQSTDGETWSSATVASSTGTPVTSITVTTTGGQYYFRVRNKRSSLVSDWTESALVITIMPPAPPTLTSPTSGQVISGTGTASVTFGWNYNPYDGSTQSAAKLRYRKDPNDAWTTVTISGSSTTSTQTLTVGYTYTWQVKTKGAAATGGPDNDGYGDWSLAQTFSVYEAPSVTVTQPSGTVTTMPIQYELSYDDDYGTFVSGTISISLGGTVLYSEALPATATTMGTPSPITGEITVDEFIPSSGETYTIDVAVRSSDTLTATDTASMPVSMGEPDHGTLDISNDPETGYVSLTVGWDAGSGDDSADHANLYRITDSGRVLIAENLSDGDGIVDMYAPLNTPYQYEVVTVSSALAVFSVPFDNELDTARFFAYWNNNIAWGKWNPTGQKDYERPEKKLVHYAGRPYPVSYDGTAMGESHSISFAYIEGDGNWSASMWRRLMEDGGRGVYKSVDGNVFHADFVYSESPAYTSVTRYGEFSLQITRIDGGVL